VRDRNSQADVAHAFAADNAAGNDFTVFIDGSFTASNALVFGVVRVNVLDWSENALTEQTIAFRLLSSVVNGFRLGNFAVAPVEDILRAGYAEANCRKVGNLCRMNTYAYIYRPPLHFH
jgi:hypothetical protein